MHAMATMFAAQRKTTMISMTIRCHPRAKLDFPVSDGKEDPPLAQPLQDVLPGSTHAVTPQGVV
jgi:hypothetical protein